MRKLLLLVSLIIVFSTIVQSQFIKIPNNNRWEWTQQKANLTYLFVRENNLKDTVINMYMNRRVLWLYKPIIYPTSTDTVSHIDFQVDTIVGRGDKRQALFRILVKTADSTLWIITKENYVAIGDTLTQHKVDTIGTTGDFTHQALVWLTYTNPNSVYTLAEKGKGRKVTWYLSDNYSLNIWLEKITGDPTKFQGRNQLCLIHFQLKEEPTQEWLNAQNE